MPNIINDYPGVAALIPVAFKRLKMAGGPNDFEAIASKVDKTYPNGRFFDLQPVQLVAANEALAKLAQNNVALLKYALKIKGRTSEPPRSTNLIELTRWILNIIEALLVVRAPTKVKTLSLIDNPALTRLYTPQSLALGETMQIDGGTTWFFTTEKPKSVALTLEKLGGKAPKLKGPRLWRFTMPGGYRVTVDANLKPPQVKIEDATAVQLIFDRQEQEQKRKQQEAVDIQAGLKQDEMYRHADGSVTILNARVRLFPDELDRALHDLATLGKTIIKRAGYGAGSFQDVPWVIMNERYAEQSPSIRQNPPIVGKAVNRLLNSQEIYLDGMFYGKY